MSQKSEIETHGTASMTLTHSDTAQAPAPYAYEIGRQDRTQMLVYPAFLERYATAEEHALPRLALYAAPVAPAAAAPFQERVQPWMLECFGAEIAADRIERNHRFFEEATELVQACGMTASEAHQLVDYVFGRPVGRPHQEVGGVMVTLAALCLANSLDMHVDGETELARISVPETVAKIRAKQAAKPKHSPLPEAAVANERFGAVELILRDVCENEPADPEQNDTVCIDISDLKIILDRHVEGSQQAASLLEWAIERWNAEVRNRPLVNVHRRSLDDTWRQVIRHCGANDVALLGPKHGDLVAAAPTPTVAADAAAQPDERAAFIDIYAQAFKQTIADRESGVAREIAEMAINTNGPSWQFWTAARAYARAEVPQAGATLTDERIIERCKAAGIRWLEPEPADGFPGAFELVEMHEMRALLGVPPEGNRAPIDGDRTTSGTSDTP